MMISKVELILFSNSSKKGLKQTNIVRLLYGNYPSILGRSSLNIEVLSKKSSKPRITVFLFEDRSHTFFFNFSFSLVS
jgi:hypothetical protein